VDTARNGLGLNGSGVGINKTELQHNRKKSNARQPNHQSPPTRPGPTHPLPLLPSLLLSSPRGEAHFFECGAFFFVAPEWSRVAQRVPDSKFLQMEIETRESRLVGCVSSPQYFLLVLPYSDSYCSGTATRAETMRQHYFNKPGPSATFRLSRQDLAGEACHVPAAAEYHDILCRALSQCCLSLKHRRFFTGDINVG
jgi:hypothetical protein